MIDGIEHSWLVQFVAKIVGEQDAEDVVQDVYLKFLSGQVPAHRGEASRVTWVCAVAKYTAYRLLEQKAREQMTGLIDASYTPQYDTQIDIRQALRRVRPADRHILALYHTHGSYRAVARAASLRVNQVRNRLRRARQRVKEQLA